MAELVDAADSKSAVRKDVQVRFLFWAPKRASDSFQELFYLAHPCSKMIKIEDILMISNKTLSYN